MELATKRGALPRLACALVIVCSVPGCITYATTTNTATYCDLGIAAALATVEIGVGVLGGYLLSKDESSDDDPFGPMISVPGGILLVDAIVALGLYLSDDS